MLSKCSMFDALPIVRQKKTNFGRHCDVAPMIDLSRHIMANIGQTIAVTLALKVIVLVTTTVGGPWPKLARRFA